MITQSNALSGILLVNKPVGMTSHDVVDQVRRITGQRQIGHAGTLDPLASGLLVVCIGKATKVTKYLSAQEKSYRAVLHLGLTSPTYDREGVDEASEPVDTPSITREQIEAVLTSFRGSISQTVPAYSAVHVGGQRLHEMARRGDEVELPSRQIAISSLTITQFDNPMLSLDVTCSKGTYIRSLAHDIGQALGCGAYLHDLTRIATENLRLEDALSFDDIESRWTSQALRDDLLSIGEALTLPAIVVNDAGERAVANGITIKGSIAGAPQGAFACGDTIVIKNQHGRVLAVGSALVNATDLPGEPDHVIFKYARVLI